MSSIDIDLNSIVLADCPAVTFEESLRLVDSEGGELDKVIVVVEDAGENLLVYQYSCNEDRMMRVKSSVKRSLYTDSEVRRIRRRPNRTTMMRITGNQTSYKVFALYQECKDACRWKMDVNILPSDPFILLEGATIVLLRKIAIIGNVCGQFQVRTIDHGIEFCDCLFEVESSNVQRYITIRRTMRSSRGTEVMTTILTREGRILSHQWSGSEWRLEADEEQEEAEDEGLLEDEVKRVEKPLKADQTAYFQRKEEVLQKLKLYFLDHLDIQDIIADMVKNVLFEQPEDVVDFADSFFSQMTAQVDRSPYVIDTASNINRETASSKNGIT